MIALDTLTAAVAAVAVLAWAYLLLARGGFWRAADRDDDPRAIADIGDWPSVAAVIPARDEADAIGPNLASLSRQDYPGRFSVIVVDDHSSDDTARIAQAAGRAAAHVRVDVLRAPPLAPGWSGKLAAIACGIRHAEASAPPPDYLLLTDADIAHAPDTLRMLVARARRDDLVLHSLMAKLDAQRLCERALIPAFVFFFAMLYPFAWVGRRERRIAAAAGGCMLVERDALRRAGGIAAIRGELIDDCALARLLKPHGAIRLALTDRVRSTRVYASFGEIRRMIARTAFTQLRCSPWLLAGAVVAMSVVFAAPPLLALFAGEPAVRAQGALAWAAMTLAFVPMLRFYRVSPAWAPALPAIASAYVAFTLDSALRHWRGRGGEWKGRVQAASRAVVAGPRMTPLRHLRMRR